MLTNDELETAARYVEKYLEEDAKIEDGRLMVMIGKNTGADLYIPIDDEFARHIIDMYEDIERDEEFAEKEALEEEYEQELRMEEIRDDYLNFLTEKDLEPSDDAETLYARELIISGNKEQAIEFFGEYFVSCQDTIPHDAIFNILTEKIWGSWGFSSTAQEPYDEHSVIFDEPMLEKVANEVELVLRKLGYKVTVFKNLIDSDRYDTWTALAYAENEESLKKCEEYMLKKEDVYKLHPYEEREEKLPELEDLIREQKAFEESKRAKKDKLKQRM